MPASRRPLSLTARRAADRAADRAYDRGNDLAAEGRLEEAEACYREAVAARPDFAEAHNNLGNVLSVQGRLVDAVAAYRAALALGLDHPLVHYNLATALKQAGQAEEAERRFRLALALAPEHAETWNNFANLLRDAGAPEAAAAAYLRALALVPDWDEAHDNLSGALYLLHEDGGEDAAVRLARVWTARHPDHPLARHAGAALAGGEAGPRAPDAYVRQVFDHFADEFDAKLRDLEYRAPEILAEALRAEGIGAGLDVLDAGCGTGLCAPLLRGWARSLTGVDLSPGMLEKARGRGGYDRLEEAELGAFLDAHAGRFDLIVAADVLCYFGDLSGVLGSAARALRPGGTLAFTVERLDGGPDHRVNPHGRYAHAEAHVRRALASAGLAPRRVERATLRFEAGKAVEGLAVVAGPANTSRP